MSYKLKTCFHSWSAILFDIMTDNYYYSDLDFGNIFSEIIGVYYFKENKWQHSLPLVFDNSNENWNF